MRKVIVSLALCVSVFAMCGFVKAEDFSLRFASAMNQMNTSLFTQNKNIVTIQGVIKNYCDVVLAASGFTENGFTYSARQSTFVYFLCGQIGKSTAAGSSQLFVDGKIFKLSSRKELGLKDIHYMTDAGDTKTDFCALGTNLSKCNLSKYVPQLFNMIINDYTNLKQPSLYGFTPGVTDEIAANTFSKSYFNGLEICSKEGERLYPASCASLKKYISDAGKVLADVQIFDTAQLFKIKLLNVCDTSNAEYSLLLCGLYGDTQFSLQHFLNLSYNELFYYRMFAQYYAWMITTRTSEILRIPLKEVNSELFARTTDMTNELTWSQQALSVSMRMLRDFYTSFPLHIGFLMYKEDLQTMSVPLGKLYTPLSQLYYTLKNVQKKE